MSVYLKTRLWTTRQAAELRAWSGQQGQGEQGRIPRSLICVCGSKEEEWKWREKKTQIQRQTSSARRPLWFTPIVKDDSYWVLTPARHHRRALQFCLKIPWKSRKQEITKDAEIRVHSLSKLQNEVKFHMWLTSSFWNIYLLHTQMCINKHFTT